MNAQDDPLYTLDEISREVEKLLRCRGFYGDTPDNRVAAAPDGRTIRYYTTLGLLERPFIVERQARYGKRHLLQLLTIKALQSLSIPLAEIQQRLYGRSDDEMEAILTSLEKAGKNTRTPPPVLRWNEIMIRPGIKVLVEDRALEDLDPDSLTEDIWAAMAALKSSRQRKEHKK